LYTDEDIHGAVVDLLVQRGWDLVRAVDRYRQGTEDPIHFEQAAAEGRVFVTNDQPSIGTAESWLRDGRPFQGVVTWHNKHYARMSIGKIVEKIEDLTQEDDPFFYPIRRVYPD
jgi:hypothetical protein